MIKSDRNRREPYSERGLSRMRCSVPKCKNKAAHQWKIGSCNARVLDRMKPVCDEHDLELNNLVISYFNLEEKN